MSEPLVKLSREQLRYCLIHGRGSLHFSQRRLSEVWGVSRAKIARWEALMGPEIPNWVFYGMIGMLLERGKIVDFVADRLPEKDHNTPRYASLQPGRSHWAKYRG